MTATTYSTRRLGSGIIWVFDAMADAFYRSHRMMAPGKSIPAEMYDDTRDEDRSARYSAWRSCLGPIDVACILSVAEMRERDE
jgi:hypothetical protein